MTNVHQSSEQDSLGNILSPEAKEFVPRHVGHVTSHVTGGPVSPEPGDGKTAGQHPVNGIPSYMTTCYPFVSGSDQRFSGGRPRMRGKYPQMMTSPQYPSMQQGLQRNRFPHPGKGYWNQGATSDMYPPFANVPNGMPFDGGTPYQNGLIRSPHIPHMAVHHDPNKPVISPGHSYPGYPPSPTDVYMDTTKHVNGYTGSPFMVNASGDGSVTSHGDTDRRRTVCYKNSSIQTDFPNHIANATLDDLPNSLYNEKQSAHRGRHKAWRMHKNPTDCQAWDDDELDSGYGSAFHKKNQVSNGTNPAMGVAIGNVNPVSTATSRKTVSFAGSGSAGCHGDMSSMQGNSEPSTCDTVTRTAKFSYASVAQSKPSHKKLPVVTATAKGDTASCDSSKKVLRSGAKQGYSSLNVNVAQIMQDLEKADNIQHHEATRVQASATSVQASASGVRASDEPHRSSCTPNHSSSSQSLSAGPLTYNTVVKQGAPKSSNNSNSGHMTPSSSHHMGSNKTEGHGDSRVKGQMTDLNDSKLSNEGHVSDTGEGSEVKKKRRRRRTRRRKSGDVVSGNDDANSGANEEITLHFEDAEEFPDLMSARGGNDPHTSSPGLHNISYSDILKTNNPVQSSVTTPSQHSSQDEALQCSQDNSGAKAKESRNSRKRRKRRDVANKAADAELAEINLEQHMLELKMKQKHPLSATAKKSVSPVRASPSQGVWKLPPSSPASQGTSGKKVSLLLPGTVAPESPVSSPQPLPVNTGAKQHGILKTSQPVSQPASQPSSGGGGGSGSKKSKQPITYDLGAMIDALEARKDVPPPKKEVRAVVPKKDEAFKPHNILDSSAPAKRGKERETPKLKKPSPLKKVILKEREEKKRLRLLDEDEVTSGAPVGIGLVSGESDLSQDAGSSKGSMEVSQGTPASAELSPISQPSPTCMSPMSPSASPLSSGLNSPITGTIQQTVKLKIHSRRFREYCNQVLDKEIDNSVTLLLTDLVRFQDKQYHKDPIKAKAKRRFVLGLREVTKHLKLKKIKCVIISPNLEKIQSKGGLDDALNNILELCNIQYVPFVFALGRRALGRACAKLVPVSVVGIFNFEGSEENFRAVVSLTEKAREAYREMISQIEKEIADYPPRTGAPGLPHIFAHMGHSRTPSGCSVISFTSSILSEPISENYPCSEPETDNRGYEIEKNPPDSSDINQNNILKDREKDPYEADDESGFERSKRLGNKVGPNSSVSNTVNDSRKVGQENMSDMTEGCKCETSDDLEKLKIKEEGSDADMDNTDATLHHYAYTNTNPALQGTTGEDIDVGKNRPEEDSDNSNDLDFETCEEEEDEEEDDDDNDDEDDDDDSDAENCKERADTIEDLPQFIESVHHYDLNEILSQHSSKTIENGEDVMSTHSSKTTHSSRTLGEGGSHVPEKPCTVKPEVKNTENSGLCLRGKTTLDKENRTLSWVQEAQSLHFSEEDEGGSVEVEEPTIDRKSVTRECLDAVA